MAKVLARRLLADASAVSDFSDEVRLVHLLHNAPDPLERRRLIDPLVLDAFVHLIGVVPPSKQRLARIGRRTRLPVLAARRCGIKTVRLDPSPRPPEFVAIQIRANLARLNWPGFWVVHVEYVEVDRSPSGERKVKLVLSHNSRNGVGPQNTMLCQHSNTPSCCLYSEPPTYIYEPSSVTSQINVFPA
jgi:hypothetical protein